MINVIRLTETVSTNLFLKNIRQEQKGRQQKDITIAVAAYQSAGRGQGTNSWESERGKNLLFSILTHPTTLPVERQYILSEAAALSYKEVLDTYTEGISIKWPNDIYWQDRKISGTLIETTLKKGAIKDFIIGTGININQQEFRSDAPNPVSLRQITGRKIPLDEVLSKVVNRFEKYYQMVIDGNFATISDCYHAALYRREGFYPYRDKDGAFTAEIVRVEDNGYLVLRDSEGNLREYGFKEIQFIIHNA